MTALLGEVVFSVAETPYDWADVLLGARLRSDWSDLEAQVRLGLACAKRADDQDEGADPGAVETAANEFRYERDLLSAEEMEAWLARWDLSAETWMASVRRAVLRRQWAEEADEVQTAYPVTDEEVEAVIWAECVLSGRLAEYAHALAGRAAVFDRARQEGGARFAAEAAEEARQLLEAGLAEIPGVGLRGVPEDTVREKARRVALLEAVFRRVSAELVTPRALRDQLGAHRLDWVHLDCHYLAFPDEQMAREAALSVREDGLTLAEVADAAKTAMRQARFFLDQLAEPVLRDSLLGARKGDLIGPLKLEDEFALFLVLDKALPSVEDPETSHRAAEAALAGAVEREITMRVQWHGRRAL